MPGYKGHLTGALGLYIIILFLFSLYYFKASDAIQWLIAILAGSLFPDIDIKSKGQKLFYRAFFCILAGCLFCKSYVIAGFLGLLSVTPLMVKHRGLFHRWWFLLIIIIAACQGLICYFPLYQNTILINAVFFFIGVLSHLWLDMGFKGMIRLR